MKLEPRDGDEDEDEDVEDDGQRPNESGGNERGVSTLSPSMNSGQALTLYQRAREQICFESPDAHGARGH
jgi:hypothetical protein